MFAEGENSLGMISKQVVVALRQTLSKGFYANLAPIKLTNSVPTVASQVDLLQLARVDFTISCILVVHPPSERAEI